MIERLHSDELRSALFVRRPAPEANVIAIVGGGFTGAMVMANLLRFADSDRPLHIILIDRQAALGEGTAYRTDDPRHLLNVPASRMSAWPDRPEDFLLFAGQANPLVQAGDFLPRQLYGQYVRGELFRLAACAPAYLSAEMIQDEVTDLVEGETLAWKIRTAGGRTIGANLIVLAVGHRPPDSPSICNQWAGPHHRYIADPWDTRALRQIGPEEPVLLIGSGLTAIDVILTLAHEKRTAPIVAISRRGSMPTVHASNKATGMDLSAFLSDWLEPGVRVTVRRLMQAIRTQVAAAAEIGVPWQHVLDALRGATPDIWRRLDDRERARFLRHVRPYWEVHRHRMAPAVAELVDRLRRENVLQIIAGNPITASADSQGVDIGYLCRGLSTPCHVRASWVVNCTGPGSHHSHKTHAFLRPLLDRGLARTDDLGLGLITDESGRILSNSNRARPDLLVAGTLRKATLWESTAVPELRQQAQQIARTAIATLTQQETPSELDSLAAEIAP